MNFNDLRANENKGFSLVELIVVMAIMAVMTAVLAPALLGYVERSRAQKDDSAMGEVANAVNLALSDQDVYDEVLFYSAKKNYSCYSDKAGAAVSDDSNITVTKGTKGDEKYAWMRNDSARTADEEEYKFDGVMRGMTITFIPEAAGTKKTEFKLANAVINDGIYEASTCGGNAVEGNKIPTGSAGWVNGDPGEKLMKEMTADNANHYLYNRVRSIIGDSIELTSQTYRNSDYTVFVRMGTTGGNTADAQDAIKVYGQWSGTNLDNSAVRK